MVRALSGVPEVSRFVHRPTRRKSPRTALAIREGVARREVGVRPGRSLTTGALRPTVVSALRLARARFRATGCCIRLDYRASMGL
jgi:hypothetical protein